jgi:NADH-quinone oxidoreductase subunit H
MAEAESELTAGFHTEYSGMKFALFFLAEYVNIFIVCAIGATLFLGGWMPFHIGGWQGFNHIMDFVPSSLWFIGKTFFLIFVIMWFRWTFPRLRIDQLLNLEWKYLLPISLFNLLLMTVIAINKWHF